jgi:hypothetical protein
VLRTLLDSGVLIAAARATEALGARALALFHEPERVCVSSECVRLEVFPKAIYCKRYAEVGFYEDYSSGGDADRVSCRIAHAPRL